MVGVPRSQGCKQCRRRKKGCDLKRPTCGQCDRLGISCAWDEPRWTFVSQTMQLTENGPSRSSRLSVSRQSESRSRSKSRSQSISPPAALPAFLRRSLERSAVESQTTEIFWAQYLPRNDGRLQVDGVKAVSWATTLQNLADRDATAHLALQAVAFTALGRTMQDDALLQQGSQLYGRALVETNRALQQPLRAQSDEMLATIKFLSFYEAWRLDKTNIVSTQGHDYQKHVFGTCRLVELRGPRKHVSQDGHSLFVDIRAAAVINGIVLRKAKFFSGTDWHTTPWEDSGRDLRDELYDIAIAIPDILHRFDRLKQTGRRSCSDDCGKTAGQIFKDCISTGEKLRSWESKALATCHATSRAAGYTKSRDSIGNVDPGLEIPTLLEACTHYDYGFSHIVMMFWGFSLLLYSTAWLESRDIPRPQGQTEEHWPNLPAWLNPRPFASCIAQCAHHFFRPEAGLWGSQTVTFPMGAALHFYAATGGLNCIEMEHLKTVLRSLKNGAVTGGFLRSFAAIGARDRTVSKSCNNGREHYALANAWYGRQDQSSEPT